MTPENEVSVREYSVRLSEPSASGVAEFIALPEYCVTRWSEQAAIHASKAGRRSRFTAGKGASARESCGAERT